MPQNTRYIETAKKLVDSANVISFDIFDTLLLRPYLSPKDLFIHLENEYSLKGFYQARIEAEKLARNSNIYREDITIDDIYNNIDRKFNHVKKMEMDWELKVLVANPEMKIIWDYAKEKNKKIIIISDMYLSSDFLKKVLSKNGFEHYEKIYVSNEFEKTKKTGNLFKHVITDLGIEPNKIIHLGDNKNGDYLVPKKLGIHCLLYMQVIQQFLKSDKHAYLFHQEPIKNLGNSILIALFAWRWKKISLGLIENDYWKNIGYNYAAPLAYSYSRWVEHTAKQLNIDNLLFVARDGYLIQKFFRYFNNEIKSTYIYAPRFLNLTCRLNYDVNNVHQIDAILQFFSKKYPEIKELEKFNEIKTLKDKNNFLLENYSLFEEYANYEFDNYKSYIQSVTCESENLAVIDTKTIAFTSQVLLENSLSKKITGLYWSTVLPSKINEIKYFEFLPNIFPQYDSKIFSKNWKFIEILLSSPEYPIKGIDQKMNVIYEINPSQEEVKLRTNFRKIDQGVDEFLKDVKCLFGTSNLLLEGYSMVEWMNIFCKHPRSVDLKYISEISQAGDAAHNNYKPIFYQRWTLKSFFKNPKKNINFAKKSLWKDSTQVIILNIFRPIKIKVKNKKIKICILPYLQLQYFIFAIYLIFSFKFELSIGDFNE